MPKYLAEPTCLIRTSSILIQKRVIRVTFIGMEENIIRLRDTKC